MPIVGGEASGNAIVEVANYSALPAANTVPGELYAVLNSQGTWWLPGTLGGNYYNKGLYYSDGTNWVYTETPYNASQATVDAGTNDDQFVTPKTFTNAAKWALYQLALTATNFGAFLNGLTAKTSLADNDEFTITDSAASYVGKKITWANIKSALATVFYLDATSSIQNQLDNRSTLLAKNNIQTTHTGTTSETLILSYELTGLLALNDLLKTNFRIYPNSTANNKTVRIKVNSSASLVGASTIGTYTFTSSCINFKRSLWFENSLASIKSMYPTSSVSNDETVLSNITGLNSTTFDFTGPVFILITAQLTVSTDTLYFLNGEINRIR